MSVHATETDPNSVFAEEPDSRVLHEQVALVYASMRTALWADPLLATLFASILAWETRDIAIFGWLLLIYYHWSRVPALLRRFQDTERPRPATRWRDNYRRGTLLNSITWGLAPLFFLPDELPLIALTMLFMMGLCMSGAIMIAPLRRAANYYIVPMNACLVMALLLHPSVMNLVLAGGVMVFVGTILHFAHVQSASLEASLRARFENETLAAKLAAQVRETEAASQHKTRFLATASHDLRQPMHAIALLGSALELQLQGRSEQATAERLMRAVRALGHSLDSMLDISRLDADVVQPQLQPVALQELFQTLNQTFVDAASGKDLALRVRATGLWVHSDLQLLLRLLSNLLDNAIKYTRSGGILLVARQRPSAGERAAPEVWVEVYDTGIGITPLQQSRVYEEFYQVCNPGRDRALGLGIGLSIVARLSRLLTHPLELRSHPGRGTRFRVRLPQSDATCPLPTPHQIPAALSPASARLPHRVLVLDDEADIRDAMQQLLGTHGILTITAADEMQAMSALASARAAQTPFDLLICDFRLAHGVDGLDLGQSLAHGFAPLPLLLITGETSPERLQRVRDAGVPVLFKPVSSERLLQTIALIAR